MTHVAPENVLRYLKLLANETRLKLLGLLAQREHSVGELASLIELKEPTISHHLSKLRAAGLARLRADGVVHYYSLDTDVLQSLSRDLFTPERVTSFAAATGYDSFGRKVLNTFLDGERLTKIPDTRKKRDVILQWLVAKFQRDKRYPEREINRIIKQHHPDCATLRRELIGARLMEREKGVYWRV